MDRDRYDSLHAVRPVASADCKKTQVDPKDRLCFCCEGEVETMHLVLGKEAAIAASP